MGLKVDAKTRAVDILLSKKIYHREAVTLAAAVFARKAEFLVGRESSSSIVISLRAKDGISPAELRGLAGEFLNETLNQDLRLDLAKENARIIQLLVAQTLASARGNTASTVDVHAEKKLSEEAERLMDEAGCKVRK